MNLDKTWIAIGEKHGGTLCAGVESFLGVVVKMSEPARLWGLRSEPLFRAGIGLGGGVQGVIMFFFEVDDPQNETIGNGGFDPSVDISLGERWGSFLDTLKGLGNGRMGAIARNIAGRIAESGITGVHAEDMARLANLVKDTPGLAETLAGKGIISFDIPGAGLGVGLGISVYSSKAKLDRFALQIDHRRGSYGNIHYARGFVGALLGITTNVTIMAEQDRNRFVEGINHYNRLNAVSWRDREHRTLLQHIMNQYFRDQPNMRTETRTTHINREELASRMAQFMDRHPNNPIESGWY